MSENRSDDTSGPTSQPSPFSREGSDGPADGASANGSSALDPTSVPATPDPATPDPAPAAPQSWPGYPEPAGDSTYQPFAAAPEQPGPTPYGSPAAPEQPGPTPYGSPTAPDQGYGQPPAPYGQVAGYGSNPYEPTPNPYQPSYGGYSPYGVGAVQHPKATPALIFGIIGLVLSFSCGIGGLLGIGGIINGRRARQEIDADPQRYIGRGMASAGFGLGLAGTIIGSLVVIIIVIAAASGAFSS